jgi:hypothetical protein
LSRTEISRVVGTVQPITRALGVCRLIVIVCPPHGSLDILRQGRGLCHEGVRREGGEEPGDSQATGEHPWNAVNMGADPES